jgi:hypothetical protein
MLIIEKMTKRTRALRDMKMKQAMKDVLRKYNLVEDLDKAWDLGLRNVFGIPWMNQQDIIDSNLKGTLSDYMDIFKKETGKDPEAYKEAYKEARKKKK